MYEVAEAPVKPAAQLPQLKAAGKLLRSTPDRLGWLQPTDPGIGMAALKARYRETGYLWLKGLLDRDEVIEFRRHVFSRFVDLGNVGHSYVPASGAGDWKETIEWLERSAPAGAPAI